MVKMLFYGTVYDFINDHKVIADVIFDICKNLMKKMAYNINVWAY